MYAIDWDPEKARANLEKHGVRFSDAEVALFDPHAITVEDETSGENGATFPSDWMRWAGSSSWFSAIARKVFV